MICAKIATDGVDSPTLNDSDVLISYEGCGCAGGLVTTGYRVFSSVLGGELVSIETDQTGERRKVKVYAAEAVVGERSQRTLTGQSPTQTFAFFHADPLTGETSNKVFDALGQVVETTLIEDPDPEPFPPPENLRPGFSEWRCNVAAAFGQTFYEMPNDCRKAFHNETWKVRFVKKEGDATAISKTSLGHHESLHTFDRETSVSDNLLARTIRSTEKKTGPDGEEGKCDWDKDGTPDCAVTVTAETPMIDMSDTGVTEASIAKESRNMRDLKRTIDDVRTILSENGGDNECALFFGGAGIEALDAIVKFVEVHGEKVFRSLESRKTGIRMRVPTLALRGQFISTSSVLPDVGNGSRIVSRFQATSPSDFAINTQGPFIDRFSRARIGSYQGVSRRSRAAQLLHEIGHLVIKDIQTHIVPSITGGKLIFMKNFISLDHLLSLDGDDEELSSDNLTLMLKACGKQIDSLE